MLLIFCGYLAQDSDCSFNSDRDLLMLMNLNGRERSRRVFEDLLAACDPPLRIHQIHEPPKGELVLIEARLRD